MYFEIWQDTKLIKRGTDLLGGLKWDNELMYTPSTKIELPIYYRDYLSGREIFKIFVNGKVFPGIVMGLEEDKEKEILEVDLEHWVYEWTYRQISVNNAIKDKNINIVFKGAETETVDGDTVSANPFTIMLEEWGTFTDAMAIERSGAFGYTANGEALPVTTNGSEVVKGEAGEYDTTFTAGKATVTVKVTVKEDPEVDEEAEYKISANSFSMTDEEVGTFTDADYIQRANCWTQPEGLEIEVDHSSVRTTYGTYSVIFKAKYIDYGDDESESGEYGEYGSEYGNEYGGEYSEEEGDEEPEEKEMSVTVNAIVAGENNSDPTVADNIADIYADMNFAYPGWKLNMSDKAKDETIDYVYSRQDKLEALTKTMELTDDLFWRVGFTNERVIDIGEMGNKKDWIISVKPSGKKNIRLIKEPTVEHLFDHVFNIATVYSEKSDTGMSSMTLREVYNNPSLQEDGFPVVILRANVNNERDYRSYSDRLPVIAPNNELEYAVIDEESIALEGGAVIETTFAFNDLAPFAEEIDGETTEITDADRIRAAKQAYDAAIKKLKLLRRRTKMDMDTEELPAEINVGDKVRFVYDNNLYITEACSSYERKILKEDDWFYVTKVSYDIDPTGAEVDTVTLEKYLHIDRETR